MRRRRAEDAALSPPKMPPTAAAGQTPSSMRQRIEAKLAETLAPAHLEIVNESANHNVPQGAETHFKVVVVSPQFEGERLLARHRRVNAALAAELSGGVHALAIHTYTTAEWQRRFGDAPMSPPCHGGDGSLPPKR